MIPTLHPRCAAGLMAALLAGTAAAQEAPAPAVPTPDPRAPFARTLPETLAGVPGTWDLSRDGSPRRCVLTFSGESGDAGRRLSFPAGCRRALPVLGPVAAWLFTDGEIRLVDRNVRPVLAFAPRPDQRSLAARAEGGEAYSLVPLDILAMRPADPVASPAPSAPAPAEGAPPAEDAPAEPRPAARADAAAPTATVSGLYSLDRYNEPDVCRLELAPDTDARKPTLGPASGPASGPVHLRGACRDPGLAVFDPVTWRYANGRLTLTARRGHSLSLVPTGGGRWRRDPETGVTFVLHRVAS